MNLLINEPPLQVLPSLAKKIGLNEAIFLQQLHFRLLISTNERDGYKWIYKSLADWHEEFPFISYDTLKRVVAKLEKEGYIVTSKEYNRIKMDKTKWYRIDYSKLIDYMMVQNTPTISAKCTNGKGQNAPTEEGNLHQPIPKNLRELKNNNVEQLDDIVSYLNTKTGKQFRATTSATKRVISARLNEGFTVEDFKQVIDIKCKQWLNDAKMNRYLQPATLFGNKFEGYLNEAPKKPTSTQTSSYEPPNLDFRAGEELQ